MSDKELYEKIRHLVREAELAGSGNVYASDSLSLYTSDVIDYIATHYLPKSLVREAIGSEWHHNSDTWCAGANTRRSDILTKLGLEANE